MTLTISTASCEYVKVPVAAAIAGQPYNPTNDLVRMAFRPDDKDPISTDWVNAVWETSTGGGSQTYAAMALLGPGGAIQLEAGVTYRVWVRVVDSPEAVVRLAGAV